MTFYQTRKLQQSQKRIINEILDGLCPYAGFLVIDCINDGINTPFSIASATGMYPSAVSKAVTELLAVGLVTSTGAKGARTRAVTLTDHGLEIHHRATSAAAKVASAVDV